MYMCTVPSLLEASNCEGVARIFSFRHTLQVELVVKCVTCKCVCVCMWCVLSVCRWHVLVSDDIYIYIVCVHTHMSLYTWYSVLFFIRCLGNRTRYLLEILREAF